MKNITKLLTAFAWSMTLLAAPAFAGVEDDVAKLQHDWERCLLYTSPSPRDVEESRMPSSA